MKGLIDRGDVVVIDGKGGPGDPHRYANVEDFASLYVRKGKKVGDATYAKEILLKVNAVAELHRNLPTASARRFKRERVPMTVRGGGVPIAPLGFHAGKKNGSAASELRRRCA